VLNEIKSLRTEIENGLTREALQQRLPAGAARNALDCALIDLEAKTSAAPPSRASGPCQGPFPCGPPSRSVSIRRRRWGKAAANAAAKRLFPAQAEIAGAGDLERVEAVRQRRLSRGL